MNPVFAYLIKSSLSLIVLYSLFRFILRNDRNHVLNRFLLLGILVVSALIPFLDIQFFYETANIKQIENFREFVSVPIITEAVQSNSIQPEMISNNKFEFNPWLALYLAVLSLLVLRLIIGVFRVLQIIRKSEKRRFNKLVLALVHELIQPFTFLNKIIISKKDYTENKAIVVAHEHAHIKQLHAIDLVICELFTLLHFFNPFIWMLRRDLKLIHEYQADQAVLQKGIDAKKYQLLVLEKAVGERRFAMANHFTQKPIIKRLKMMSKTKTQKWNGWKLILFVPVLIVLLQAFARPELITNSDEFIPVKYTENKKDEWLSKWSLENIGDGFYEPAIANPTSPGNAKNVLVILQNRRNQFLIENEYATKEQIKKIVSDFLIGKDRKGKMVVDFVEKEIPLLGTVKVSKGIISFRYDMESSGEMKSYTYRSVGEAYLKVRNEKSQLFFKTNYFDLNIEQQKAINLAVPISFTIEKPKVFKKGNSTSFNGESLSLNEEQLLASNDKQFVASTKKVQNQAKVRVEIQDNKVSVNKYLCKLENLQSKVEKLLEEMGGKEVELLQHQPKELSVDFVKKVRGELEKIPDIKIKDRTVEIMRIEKGPKPPPPPPIFIVKMYENDVTVSDKSVTNTGDSLEAAITKRAKEFFKKAGKKHTTRINVYDGLPDKKVDEMKSILIEAGLKNIKIRRID